jgi:hypothetical protein
MAITNEQIWDAPRSDAGSIPGDAFAFGRPAGEGPGESAHLLDDVDWNRVVRATTTGFFDERDPDRQVRATVAKILGVIVVLSGIALLTLGLLAFLGGLAIDAALG